MSKQIKAIYAVMLMIIGLTYALLHIANCNSAVMQDDLRWEISHR